MGEPFHFKKTILDEGPVASSNRFPVVRRLNLSTKTLNGIVAEEAADPAWLLFINALPKNGSRIGRRRKSKRLTIHNPHLWLINCGGEQSSQFAI
jgi:hypothetical protein